MDEIYQNVASQLGAVGLLIWFLFHLYQRIEKRLETREEQFEIQRKDLILFYENKIKAIVRDYREDAKAHKQDRDEWFSQYLEVTARLTEILHIM